MNIEVDSQTRQVQLTQLAVLKDLIAVFDRENIEYVAVGGTALGAIRHQGFIPWDDDIDIAMTRDNYERFLSLQSELPESLFIQTAETDKHYSLYFAKVRRNNTRFVEAGFENAKIHQGIFIDVFPLDRGLDNTQDKDEINELIRRFSRVTKFYAGIVGCFKSLFYRAIYPPSLTAYKKVNDAMTRYNQQGDKRWVGFHGDDFFTDAELYPVRRLPFEDIEICVPNQLEKYLTDKYGNYMEIPPENQRITHNPVEISL
ncbi:LicD family protein [Thaumasiovibrio sp. DFM-14]|uniref:LicD family protein n=1 Tax=Thaumasiovibrio sp. DFM-14 TaxID=3384792 RepID=UPI0039A2747D